MAEGLRNEVKDSVEIARNLLATVENGLKTWNVRIVSQWETNLPLGILIKMRFFGCAASSQVVELLHLCHPTRRWVVVVLFQVFARVQGVHPPWFMFHVFAVHVYICLYCLFMVFLQRFMLPPSVV